MIIKERDVKKMYKMQSQNIEYGGPLILKNGELTLSKIYTGNKEMVITNRTLSTYNFHTHPFSKNILYSFYSLPDFIEMMKWSDYHKTPVTEILITDDGIFQIRPSQDFMKLYKTSIPFCNELLEKWWYTFIHPLLNPFHDGDFYFDVPDYQNNKQKYYGNLQNIIKNVKTSNGIFLMNWMADVVEKENPYVYVLDWMNSNDTISLSHMFHVDFSPK